jgi:hypothetical protein
VPSWCAHATHVLAFPPIRDVGVLADRFNLTTPEALRAFLLATPYGLAPGLAAKISPTTDYGRGFDTADRSPLVRGSACVHSDRPQGGWAAY